MDIHAVPTDIHLPAGMAGPEPMDFDVRCYVLPHSTGLVLIDTGMPETPERVGAALADLGAAWTDVTDSSVRGDPVSEARVRWNRESACRCSAASVAAATSSWAATRNSRCRGSRPRPAAMWQAP